MPAHVGGVLAYHVRSKGPRPKGGVDPEAALAVVGSRAVGCVPTTPPLMPFVISGQIFLHFVSKPILAGAFIAFRWPTCRFFSGPLVGHVAHVPLDLLSL